MSLTVFSLTENALETEVAVGLFFGEDCTSESRNISIAWSLVSTAVGFIVDLTNKTKWRCYWVLGASLNRTRSPLMFVRILDVSEITKSLFKFDSFCEISNVTNKHGQFIL